MLARALLVMIACASFGSPRASAKVSAPVSPASGPVTAEDDVARAKRHVEKAEQHYSLAEFPAAVEEFKAAYRLVPRPGILFNLGQCYMQMKDYPNAEFSYRAYLRASPQAENKQLVEELLRQTTGAMAEEEQRASSVLEVAPPKTGRAEAVLSAGLTTASVGGAVGLASLLSVLVVEAVLLTDAGSEDARSNLFWYEKGLGAAAAMGIAAVLVGGTVAASSALVE